MKAPSQGEIILYQTADGRTNIDVKLENETVWLSAEQMALHFERDRTVIQRHIRNIYNEGELIRDTTSAKFAHMGKDGDQFFHSSIGQIYQTWDGIELYPSVEEKAAMLRSLSL